MDISRQGYYKSRKAKQKKQLDEEMIVKLVQPQRRMMPVIGGKKLYRLLKPDLDKMNIQIGRDKFFKVLSDNFLLVYRKSKYAVTTNSFHRFTIYENLIKGKYPSNAGEIYVSDITYIRVDDGFCYLSLVTDLYSRKIVGYNLSDSLNLEGSLRALKMSLKGKGDVTGSIHHSDRGIQYCSKVYTELLTEHGIEISMSEKGNPYENAVAERVNGILKEEFLLSQTFKTKELASRAVKESIKIYNEYRPHMSIDYMTPNQKYVA